MRDLRIIEGIEKKKWRKVDSFWMKENGKRVKSLEWIGWNWESKRMVVSDGFWMRENGKEVKRLEGIGLMEVETWEIGGARDVVIGIR